MKYKDVALDLYERGFQPIPVAGKRPVVEGWQSVNIDDAQVKSWAANGVGNKAVGIRTGQGEIAIYPFDCDIYDKEVASLVRKSFAEKFGTGPVRIGQAPKSLTLYTSSPGFGKITSPVWVSPDGVENRVEMLGYGQQFVAIGIHPDTGKPYEWKGQSITDVESWELPKIDLDAVNKWIKSELPKLIPSTWAKKGETSGGARSDADILDNIKPRLELSEDDARDYVRCIDENCDYDRWIAVGMALNHQFEGDEIGYSIWSDHFKQSAKYVEKTSRYKWEKIKNDVSRGGKIITMASVIKWAKESDRWAGIRREKAKESTVKWESEINACDDAHVLQDLVTLEIAKDRSLTIVDLAKLESLVKSKFQELQVTIKAKDLSRIMSGKGNGMTKSKSKDDERSNSEWCSDYVWCVFEDSFIHVPTQQIISVQSFNAKHGRDVKNIWVSAEGAQMTAANVALHEIQVRCVHRRMYLPNNQLYFSIDGVEFLNTYRPEIVPVEKEKSDWLDSDAKAVDLVESHIKMLCNECADYVIWWMAHNVQKPGLKIRHAPLIKGIEGDGKSLIGNIMAAVMGQDNINLISPKVLMTDFNGWAEGHCVGVFEEIRIPGHNRYDAANAIKPNITNDTIPIHRKGKDEYKIINTTNYIGFTNYTNALPLTEMDRRWAVIFSPFSDIKELIELKGDDYFIHLFNAVNNHSGAIRNWLKNIDISQFDPNGRAPESEAKRVMISQSNDMDGEDVIRDVIATGAVGVCTDVISTSHLSAALINHDDAPILKGPSMSNMMQKLGYMRRPDPIKWKGKAVRVWLLSIGKMSEKNWIREKLDATCVKTDDGDENFPF